MFVSEAGGGMENRDWYFWEIPGADGACLGASDCLELWSPVTVLIALKYTYRPCICLCPDSCSTQGREKKELREQGACQDEGTRASLASGKDGLDTHPWPQADLSGHPTMK